MDGFLQRTHCVGPNASMAMSPKSAIPKPNTVFRAYGSPWMLATGPFGAPPAYGQQEDVITLPPLVIVYYTLYTLYYE